MSLEPGYLRTMAVTAREDDSSIVCHQTLGGDNAVCRGFFDRWKTTPLKLAEEMDLITYTEPAE